MLIHDLLAAVSKQSLVRAGDSEVVEAVRTALTLVPLFLAAVPLGSSCWETMAAEMAALCCTDAVALGLEGGCCCCILLDLTLEVGDVTTEEMAELSAENLVGVMLLSSSS